MSTGNFIFSAVRAQIESTKGALTDRDLMIAATFYEAGCFHAYSATSQAAADARKITQDLIGRLPPLPDSHSAHDGDRTEAP